MKTINIKAFSLIELSIVILIIGILVAGVVQSSRLVSRMRILSARSITQSSDIQSIKGLLVWVEAVSEKSFDISEASNGTKISNWYDINPLSNTANKYSQGNDANKPTYIENFSNGLPGLYFNKLENDSLQGLINFGLELKDLSMFFIYNSTDNPIGGSLISIADNSAPSANFMFLQSGGTDVFQIDSIYAGDYKMTTTSNRIMSVIINKLGVGQIYENGVLKVTGNISGNVIYANPILYIGKRADNFYFNGSIGELMIFNQNPKNEDRKYIEQYLGKKWGIKVS
jgi:prepilin-type N-terminal cleavage/methylation domain-containing protein